MDRARERTGWNEPAWADYFTQQYLHWVPLSTDTFGVPGAWGARWWYGLSSGLYPGAPPSQQQAEQSHRQWKRAVADNQRRTVIDVLQSLKQAVTLWTGSRSEEESSYSLMCSPGHAATFPVNRAC